MNSSAVSPGRAGLFLLLTGQMLPLIDTSIANVALDSITQSLNASATQLELIVALYGVAFAVCLAMGSKLGDNYGRRRLFMWGVAIFGVASLLCGMANSISTLLAARAVQGAGAALIVPQILATLHITLKGTVHARAISLYGGIGGIAFIVGQMGGGWLVSADIAGLGWRNAFFINVPICLLVLAFSPRYVPETRREAHSRIDWQGTFSLALILCCLLFPMALGPELHWPWTLQLMLAAVLPLLVWMRASALSKQQRGEQPLLPPRLLKLTSIRFGMAIALLATVALVISQRHREIALLRAKQVGVREIARRIGRRQVMGRLVLTDRLGDLEPLGEQVDQRRVDVVDGLTQSQQLGGCLAHPVKARSRARLGSRASHFSTKPATPPFALPS